MTTHSALVAFILSCVCTGGVFAQCSQEQEGTDVCIASSADMSSLLQSRLHTGEEEQSYQSYQMLAQAPSCVDGDVMMADASGSQLSSASAGSKFIPWVRYSSNWYPICGHYFWDNNNGATSFCQKLGFQSGISERTGDKYSVDSMPIGNCAPGQDLTACTWGGNGWGDLDSIGGVCKSSNSVGVKVSCSGGSAHQMSSCQVPAAATTKLPTTQVATTTVTTTKACYVARSLVAAEGKHLGGTSPLSGSPDENADRCKSECSKMTACKSFAFCESGPSGCWFKDKMPTATEPANTQPANTGRGCKTYYQADCAKTTTIDPTISTTLQPSTSTTTTGCADRDPNKGLCTKKGYVYQHGRQDIKCYKYADCAYYRSEDQSGACSGTSSGSKGCYCKKYRETIHKGSRRRRYADLAGRNCPNSCGVCGWAKPPP